MLRVLLGLRLISTLLFSGVSGVFFYLILSYLILSYLINCLIGDYRPVSATSRYRRHYHLLLAAADRPLDRCINICRTHFWRPPVKRFALCYRTVVLSVCTVSVTLVHCGQTAGRIKMKLGKQVGLGPGHIVLVGDPAPLPQRGTALNFRPISVAAKWLDGSRCHLVGR